MITSEIEVFKVATRWLNHNLEERSKYAEDLILKIRLHLLPTETLRYLLKNSKNFTTHSGCVKVLNKILECRVKKLFKSLSCYHTRRYCSQKHFKLMLCGGYYSEKTNACRIVSCIDVNTVEDLDTYPSMKTGRFSPKVVYLKGDIYVFGGLNNKDEWIKSVDKYSLTSKKWSQVAEMKNGIKFYCASGFMNKIYVFGGKKVGVTTSSCLQFDTSDYSFKEVAKMNEARSIAACVVYDERIVVCGGMYNNFNDLNSVESYDVLRDKWSKMPNMNSGKYHHSLVVVKNKLFVISKRKNECEVYDNLCKKFISIKSPKFDLSSPIRAYSIGKNIFALQAKCSKIVIYDSDKNEWSEESCEVTRNLRGFSSVKVPCL